MSDTRSQSSPESQHDLRFTARDPKLYEALLGLEDPYVALREYDRRRDKDSPPADFTSLPKDLFLFAMKRIRLDTSDSSTNFDHTSFRQSQFWQYRQGAERLSMRGRRHFKLTDYVHELHAGGPDGPLVGVGLRARLDGIAADTLLAPPLYTNETEEGEKLSPLARARKLGYLPIRYDIENLSDASDVALDRLRSAVKMGVWVSQLSVVSAENQVARERDIFLEPRIDISESPLDHFLGQLPPATEPVPLKSETGEYIKNAS